MIQYLNARGPLDSISYGVTPGIESKTRVSNCRFQRVELLIEHSYLIKKQEFGVLKSVYDFSLWRLGI